MVDSAWTVDDGPGPGGSAIDVGDEHATNGVVPDGGTPVPQDAAAPEEAPDDPAPVTERLLASVLEETSALRGQLGDLDRRLLSEQSRAQAREQVIAHQRAELDTLREERRGGHLRPLVVALQKLRAELLDEAARSGATGSAATLRYFADTVLDALERAGAHRLPVTPGDEFVRGEHQVVRAEATGPEGHGRIVAVTAEGWTESGSGRLLAPAKVVVGRHQPPTVTTTPDGVQRAEEQGDD